LDTMDHLLNHTKINHYTQQQTENRESQDRRRGSQFKPYSLVASTNMLSVVEETTASMAASSNQMLQNVEGIRSSSGSDEVLSVPVLLDISPHEFWKFDTEVGSWRRMIMNLVGNSLKYTKQGHVKVSFGLRRRSDTKFLAEFRITDTGQGISEEYLKHRLYTPFSQENNLSVGTGLGLSTVRQIVSSLHGDMRVYSEVGSGTEVSIKGPLGVSTNTEVQQIQAITDTNLLEVVRQQTFCFAGFDERPLLREEPTGIQSPRVKTLVAMKNSLSNLLSQWFNSRLVDNGASVIVVEESFLENNLGDLDRPNQNLLVIGLEGRRSTVTNQINHAAHVCLLPPVGPTRMAAALKLLLEEQNTLRSLNLETSDESDRSKLRSSTSEAEPIVPCPLTIDHHKSREAILLVDDNDINLRILVTCIGRLKLQDVNLLTASDGREAVVKYTAAIEGGIRISVVFMDISMPIMDGFQATRQIRLFESDRGLAKHDRAKIMALTGLASAEALNEVKASDFDSYLRKPVNLRTIREVLAAARI
jgi:CheY-like chemotaxis protein/two-component sensor histidine kinase